MSGCCGGRGWNGLKGWREVECEVEGGGRGGGR